jgi:protein KIAA0825
MHLCNASFCFDFAFEMLGSRGIVKSSDPEKFVILIAKSADSSLGKLFEKKIFSSISALDHADISVLTAAIGATALVYENKDVSMWE